MSAGNKKRLKYIQAQYQSQDVSANSEWDFKTFKSIAQFSFYAPICQHCNSQNTDHQHCDK